MEALSDDACLTLSDVCVSRTSRTWHPELQEFMPKIHLNVGLNLLVFSVSIKIGRLLTLSVILHIGFVIRLMNFTYILIVYV